MDDILKLKDKLHAQTARIHWVELQPHFARGSLLYVAPSLDLLDVAIQFAEDDAEKLEPDLIQELIIYPTNKQAKIWYEANAEFWAVVVAPYVLIQQVSEA